VLQEGERDARRSERHPLQSLFARIPLARGEATAPATPVNRKRRRG
jgi:hypothetical protein